MDSLKLRGREKLSWGKVNLANYNYMNADLFIRGEEAFRSSFRGPIARYKPGGLLGKPFQKLGICQLARLYVGSSRRNQNFSING